jgi:hypothetical protein
MENQVGVKFTFYRMGTSITRMTDLENMQEVMNRGLESVAMDCIKEVYDATGFDLNKIAHPYSATRFCSFSELSYNSSNETLTEGKRKNAIIESRRKRETIY